MWWNLLLLAALLALLLPGARGEDELAREEDEDEEEEAGVVRLGPKGRDTIIEITENGELRAPRSGGYKGRADAT